ncbi:MAG TPA: L,D-transpeptidase, partial [Gemmatimonadota bacterium]|nr:L,D-transpeptidase [Gemmatimonadota bacterium]
GFGGAAATPTIEGRFRVRGHLGLVHTTLYRQSLGHEFYLRDFLQFQGNYGFHANKINDLTGEVEPGPTHGCVALPKQAQAALYAWADDGTPIDIRYAGDDGSGS